MFQEEPYSKNAQVFIRLVSGYPVPLYSQALAVGGVQCMRLKDAPSNQ